MQQSCEQVIPVSNNGMSFAGAIASLAAFITAKEVLKRFHYVGYDHSER